MSYYIFRRREKHNRMTNYKKETFDPTEFRPDVKFSSNVIYRNFEEGDMTLIELREYLNGKGYRTKTNKEITVAYIHTLLSYGHLPRHMGGNLLYIKRVRDTIAVKIKDEKKDFYQGNRKPKKKSKLLFDQ